jgi:hypothetical protein
MSGLDFEQYFIGCVVYQNVNNELFDNWSKLWYWE